MCWDYALSWANVRSSLNENAVAGPLFISVGKSEQLAKFLDLNPELQPFASDFLIDDTPDFAAYKRAGFVNMLGDVQLEKPPDFKPPKTMSPGKWWSYLRNVNSLAPIPDKPKFGEVPPGVKVLGGTFVLQGEQVVFSHEDVVPGATPALDDVFAAAGVTR